MSSDKDAIAARIEAQAKRIEQAIIGARRNEVMDISTMDKEVSAICVQIMHADKETVSEMETGMVRLINMLDELAEELQALQERSDRAKRT